MKYFLKSLIGPSLLVLGFFLIQTPIVSASTFTPESAISEYLKYQKGCKTNLMDCYSANSVEASAHAEVRALLGRNVIQDTKLKDLLTAQEKLRKEAEDNYKKVLEQSQKKTEGYLDTARAGGYSCVYPTGTGCTTESHLKRVRASELNVINSQKVAQCQSELDIYNRQKQQYEQCNQSFTNEKLESAAQNIYNTQMLEYNAKLAQADLACKKSEGNYSSYDVNKKECTCITGSTFASGQCRSNAQIQITETLRCIEGAGINTHYAGDGVCKCNAGYVLDPGNNYKCVLPSEVKAINSTNTVQATEGGIISRVLGRSTTPQSITTPQTEKSVVVVDMPVSPTIDQELTPLVIEEIPIAETSEISKTNFFSRTQNTFKNVFRKIAFWR